MNSRHEITNPADFGKVAVLMGGTSAEREVSLDSGQCVLNALQRKGIDAEAVDGIPALVEALNRGRFARVFNILHGNRGGGENGVLQGVLQALDVPYTGSGVLASALSINKVMTKRIWQTHGLPTPAFASLPKGSHVHPIARKLGFPLIVKPACEGSSVGVTWVNSEADLDQAQALAERYEGDLLLEQMIEGDEMTVSIVADRVLPSIHIVPANNHYDYNAKYASEQTRYVCPGLENEAEEAIRQLAQDAFDVLECTSWGRVDIMRDRQGKNWLLEVNTAPGMTPHSLVPKAGKQAGMDYDTLCWHILETSLAHDREKITRGRGDA